MNEQPWSEASLTEICNVNSGTQNQLGVKAVRDKVLPWFAGLADVCDSVSMPDVEFLDASGNVTHLQIADALVFSRRKGSPLQVLLGIHLDTVYGLESSFQTVTRPAENVLRGPGVADAKGGLLVMLAALTAFERRVAEGDEIASRVGWTVFLNPDEETGSLSSAGLLSRLAAGADFALVYEPTLPEGTLIRARKGSGNFSVVVRGRAAHAGRDIGSGRNAISALCRLFGELEKLQQDDGSVTVNVGRISGGGPVNVVPDLAIGSWNVRVIDKARTVWVEQQIRRCVEIANAADGISVELHGGMTSPPKLFDEPTAQLLRRVEEVGQRIGLEIRAAESGGVCDGNKLAAAGCPTIDTMGPRGGHIHSDQEYVLIDSMEERSKLTEELLLEFSRHPDRFPSRTSRGGS